MKRFQLAYDIPLVIMLLKHKQDNKTLVGEWGERWTVRNKDDLYSYDLHVIQRISNVSVNIFILTGFTYPIVGVYISLSMLHCYMFILRWESSKFWLAKCSLNDSVRRLL